MTEPDSPERNPADARAWFYLDHRSDIETWAALRDEARGLVDEYLLTLDGAVADFAATVGAEPFTFDLDDGPWPRFGLRAPGWTFNGTKDVSVVLEWQRSALLTPGPNEWPYVAVRLEDAGNATTRWTALHTALAPARKTLGGHAIRPWPIWRYVDPGAGAKGVDPAALATSCIADLRMLWQVVCPVLGALHLKHSNEGGAASPEDGPS